MDVAQQIDRLIEQLGSMSLRDSEAAAKALESLGEPALRRLFAAAQARVQIPWGGHTIDAVERKSHALSRLARLCPDVGIELVRDGRSLTLCTITGLGQSGEPRPKAIAQEALKTFGNNW